MIAPYHTSTRAPLLVLPCCDLQVLAEIWCPLIHSFVLACAIVPGSMMATARSRQHAAPCLVRRCSQFQFRIPASGIVPSSTLGYGLERDGLDAFLQGRERSRFAVSIGIVY
jgi:uncharacterized SAM-binding protein YcdF (DUF218 family)